MAFINNGSYSFIDISSERYRTYVYSDYTFTIESALKLAISKSGHRLWDGQKSYFIPFGWKYLYWEVKEGQPNFVK